jgi:hypothetical protein
MMAQYNAQRVCKFAQDRDFRDFKKWSGSQELDGYRY